MKICRKCSIEKQLDEFGIRKNGKHDNQCKKCFAENSREYYWKNRERANEQRRKHYYENRNETLERSREYYKNNREAIRKRANEQRKKPERREKERERGRKWAKNNRQKCTQNSMKQQKKHPERWDARRMVHLGVKIGFIIRPPCCEKCKIETKVYAHHEDYSKPLDVLWVCHICHHQIHNKMMDLKREENECHRFQQETLL